MAAGMLGSAVVQETVSLILSNMEKYTGGSGDAKAKQEEHMERLEMAHIRLEAALKVSRGWDLTCGSAPLLRWRSKLKRAAHECGETLRRCEQQRARDREEQEVEEAARASSSLPRRIARGVRSLVSSIFSSSELSVSTAAAVRRFEWFADGASEFLRFVELGGATPRQRMFFDPLVGHLFAGEMVKYTLVLGSQCHLLMVKPISTPEGSVEVRLLYVLVDMW